jgi:hypothetical protein
LIEFILNFPNALSSDFFFLQIVSRLEYSFSNWYICFSFETLLFII